MNAVQLLLQDMDGRRTTSGNGGRQFGSEQSQRQNNSPLYLSQMNAVSSAYDSLYRGRSQTQDYRVFRTTPEIGESNSLDNYDRALLAAPHQDRQWQASHGLTRLSLPPRSQAQSSSYESHQAPGIESEHGLNFAQDLSSTTLQQQPSSGHFQDFAHSYVPCAPLPNFSSPSTFPSSPSYDVSRRRTFHSRRRGQTDWESMPHTPFRPSFDVQDIESQPSSVESDHAPPTIHGIQLVSPNDLPDRFRSIFPFQVFNAVQSRCFRTIYRSDDNLVLSAPTGSGKTVVLEMAICRLISILQSGQFKIIYMAPTKSLCAERQADWNIKFRHFDLQCAELTGDTAQAQLRNIQSASIIITTPEKWDSMTRKWKDHIKLIQMVKLFLIDEVHILKDSRGAALEAVLSRMKSVGSNVRFVALSATVPNFEDVATWLGRNQSHQDLPAHSERFGEEFRPVKLRKFVYGVPFRGNDFAFEAVCDSKLPEIITKYSDKKPIMVFCCTRKAALMTAKFLATLWASQDPHMQGWRVPTRVPNISNSELRKTIGCGVAFHHAGLDVYDRQAVEKSFLEGGISVICCTSTLAVGVNLPCHLVIIKNTVSWQKEGLKEYADLEMMQMLGRAGRPQFDNSATAVILTKQEKVKKYEQLVSGTEVLESCLHLNLIDHLNAEIGLGTVHDLPSAKRWLAGTFLYVRVQQNPAHYKLDGNAAGKSLEEGLGQICDRDIKLLQDVQLVCPEQKLRCTEFGDAMNRYYIKFVTMKALLGLPPRAKMSEILCALVEAEEFHEVRFRSGEKNLYKILNSAIGIKFPIKVDIASAAQKRSIIIQAELGGVEFPTEEQFNKHKAQYQQDRAVLFSHVNRLIRCVIDCQIYLQDGPATRHALELARSLGARVWDNSPLQMKQIPGIGPISIRKLVAAGISSLEVLEATEPSKINMVLSKQQGFGENLVGLLRNFPKPRVSIKLMGKDVKPGQPPNVKIKVEVGFLNGKAPFTFNKKPVFVCFLAERSDGYLIDFRRMRRLDSAKKLGNGEDILLSTNLCSEGQYLTCSVMCDDMAGTLRYAELMPEIPASAFLTIPQIGPSNPISADTSSPTNSALRRARDDTGRDNTWNEMPGREDFPDDDIEDLEMLAAAQRVDFVDIEAFGTVPRGLSWTASSDRFRVQPQEQEWEPKRLSNGKWACNHKCKDKTACKHMCCRTGVDKIPKAPKQSAGSKATIFQGLSTKTPTTMKKRRAGQEQVDPTIEVLDLAIEPGMYGTKDTNSASLPSLAKLHKSVLENPPALLLPAGNYSSFSATAQRQQLPIIRRDATSRDAIDTVSSDYDGGWLKDLDNLPSLSGLLCVQKQEGGVLSPELSSLPDSPCYEPVKGTRELEASSALDDSQESVCEESVLSPLQDYKIANNSFATSITNLGKDSPRAKYDRSFLVDTSPEKSTIRGDNFAKPEWKRPFRITDLPAPKRQCLEQSGASELSPTLSPAPKVTLSSGNAHDLRPWDDMEGIDMDLLAEFADIVEFV